MPIRAKRPCRQPGCPGLAVKGGYCEKHQKQRPSGWKRDPALTTTQRGYGWDWQKRRTMFLAGNPLCADPFGDHAGLGQVIPATEVDHIIPKARGGGDDDDNLQALCHACHKRKTEGEGRQFGGTHFQAAQVQTTIVAGPPGGGKTSYVAERRQWGDLVVDVDALFAALSGMTWYEKPQVLVPFVMEARDAVIRRLARPSQARHAWIITGNPDLVDLETLASELGADLVVLPTEYTECIRRLYADERRNDKAQLWEPLIAQWFEKHAASKLKLQD